MLGCSPNYSLAFQKFFNKLLFLMPTHSFSAHLRRWFKWEMGNQKGGGNICGQGGKFSWPGWKSIFNLRELFQRQEEGREREVFWRHNFADHRPKINLKLTSSLTPREDRRCSRCRGPWTGGQRQPHAFFCVCVPTSIV